MTFKELIEKLKKDFPEQGVYAVFEDWYENITKHHNDESLYGMLWGLNATGYITSAELENLTTEIINTYNQNI